MQYHRIAAPTPDAQGRCCFLLPGAYQNSQSFLDEGFVRCFQAADPSCELILVEAHAQYYLDQNLVEPLQGVIKTVLGDMPPTTSAMLLGISMGGYGALRYLMARTHPFEAVLLLSPFLGERKTWLSVQAQGGLSNWKAPEHITGQDDSDLWLWLQDKAPLSPLVLGYGQQDRFNRSHQLLAQALPAAQVVRQDGDHDWASWNQLLPAVLKAAQDLDTHA